MSRRYISVDLGGHSVTLALIRREQGSFTAEQTRSETTPEGRPLGKTLAVISAWARELSGGAEIAGLGLALPGILDRERKRPLVMANFPAEWCGRDVPGALQAELTQVGLNGAVRAENDANCHALGEGAAGAAMNCRDYVVLTLGTGIGSGIVSGGRLLTGSRGRAGEAGHIVVGGDEPCACGGRGHPETLAAADGVARRAQDCGLPANFRSLWERRRDPQVKALLAPSIDALARTIASLYHLLDPETIVLAGGMSLAEGLADAVRSGALRYVAAACRDELDVRVGTIGSNAALFGACSLFDELPDEN